MSFGLLSESLQTSAALRAQPLWTILGAQACPRPSCDWPLTWPAQPLPGTLISDEFHRASEIALALDEPGLTYPTELASRLARVGRPTVNSLPQALEPEHEAVGTTPTAWIGSTSPWPTRSPWRRRRASPQSACRAWTPSATTSCGMPCRRHSATSPRRSGDVTGASSISTTRYVDAELGRLLESLQPGDLLLVVSPFGLEPLSLPKRLLERTLGNPNISGTHERAPDGFMLAYGTAVKPGRYPRGSVVDIAPTLLYYFGLPIGRDMDGFARADIFTTAFSAERPIAYIPTYER